MSIRGIESPTPPYDEELAPARAGLQLLDTVHPGWHMKVTGPISLVRDMPIGESKGRHVAAQVFGSYRDFLLQALGYKMPEELSTVPVYTEEEQDPARWGLDYDEKWEDFWEDVVEERQETFWAGNASSEERAAYLEAKGVIGPPPPKKVELVRMEREQTWVLSAPERYAEKYGDLDHEPYLREKIELRPTYRTVGHSNVRER